MKKIEIEMILDMLMWEHDSSGNCKNGLTDQINVNPIEYDDCPICSFIDGCFDSIEKNIIPSDGKIEILLNMLETEHDDAGCVEDKTNSPRTDNMANHCPVCAKIKKISKTIDHQTNLW
jgi:hypothetical protein